MRFHYNLLFGVFVIGMIVLRIRIMTMFIIINMLVFFVQVSLRMDWNNQVLHSALLFG